MTLSLDAELERFINEKVKTGQYGEPSEVIRAALHLLKEQEQLSADDLEELRREIDLGLEDFERGDVSEWNPNEFKKAPPTRNV